MPLSIVVVMIMMVMVNAAKPDDQRTDELGGLGPE
jgi:hypothetical protein